VRDFLRFLGVFTFSDAGALGPKTVRFLQRRAQIGLYGRPPNETLSYTRNPEGLRIINDRCLVRTQDGYRLVIVSGVVLAPVRADRSDGAARAW